ncbi:MAG: MaoC/PaaZ C-terminal domain-containing protein [Pseudomonadota bacterium]
MRYFEDIGDDYHSVIGRYPLTEQEVIEFAERWDPQPYHTDPEAARASIFGALTASSVHLFAICTRLFFDHDDRIQVLAMLGKDKLRLPAPARAGATLTYETRSLSRRESRSRPDAGLVVLGDTLKDQDDQVVLTQEVTLLVARRPG